MMDVVRAVRVACILVPDFAVAVERLDLPALAGQPVVVASRTAVLACSAEARQFGVHAGMPLRGVLARCAGAIVLEERAGRYQDLADRLAAAVGTLSPFVELASPGEVYASLDGLQALHPSEAALAAAIQQATDAGLPVQVGVATGKFPARVAAFLADPGTPRVVPPGQDRRTLAGLAISALPVDPAMIQRLQVFGVSTFGDLAKMPMGAVQAQFGFEGRRAWELANGIDGEPLRIGTPREAVGDRFEFDQPVVTIDLVHLVAGTLIDRLVQRVRARWQAARAITFRAELENGQVWDRTVAFREATTSARQMLLALRGKIDSWVPAAPVTAIAIRLENICAEGGTQESLPLPGRQNSLHDIRDAIRQLKARYGTSPVSTIVEVEPWSRIPERRTALLAYDP